MRFRNVLDAGVVFNYSRLELLFVLPSCGLLSNPLLFSCTNVLSKAHLALNFFACAISDIWPDTGVCGIKLN
jgi:hypothetical protein